MTIKQQINYGETQNVWQLHNYIFRFIYLRHTLPTLLYHLPCVVKNFKLWNQKNDDLLYI